MWQVIYLIKKMVLCICVFSIISSLVINVNANVSAHSAILMDAVTKEILYEKNAYEKVAMASTTKLMTSLIAAEYIENGADETVTVDSNILVGGSSMGLRGGDILALSDLIAGMLLPSGNDASNVVAFHIGGSLEGFALMMNQKAAELGMVNSSFVTPSGLDADTHYTTAYDMALLMSACLENEYLKPYMSAKEMTVEYYSGEQGKDISVRFENHNKLLTDYQYANGGKTGYTDKAGRCLVSAAEKNGLQLVAVTLNAPDDWNDHISMYESVFMNSQSVTVPLFETDIPIASGYSVGLVIKDATFEVAQNQVIERKIYAPRFIYSSQMMKGEIIGKVQYYKNGVLFLENLIIY